MTLANHPPHDRWHDWTELDAKAWPERKRTQLHDRSDHLLQL